MRKKPGAPAAPARVLVVDQDPLVRRVVRDALAENGVSVVAEAGGGAEPILLASRHRPDVVLMDILLPALDGAIAIRRIIAATPLVRVVVFTAAKDADVGLTALQAAPSGYVTKDVGLSTLPRVVQAVASGEAAVSRGFVSV